MRFRVFDKREGRTYSDEEFYINASGELFFEDIMEGRLLKPNHDYFVLQLSTGLTDISGKEIFEGDFIEWEMSQGRIYSGKVGLSPINVAFVIDVSGRHLLGDSKYGDFCHMHREHKYKIVEKE